MEQLIGKQDSDQCISFYFLNICQIQPPSMTLCIAPLHPNQTDCPSLLLLLTHYDSIVSFLNMYLVWSIQP